MNTKIINTFLNDMMKNGNGRRVFSIIDLMKLFPDSDRKTLREFLSRHCSGPDPLLIRACRGVYVNAAAPKGDIMQEIAKVCRRGFRTYLSNESVLSAYGVISQIPFDRITVMTTGREGDVSTPFGTIEFTHTGSCPTSVDKSILEPSGSNLLPSADLSRALRDYRVSRRPQEMIDLEALSEILSEHGSETPAAHQKEECYEPSA